MNTLKLKNGYTIETKSHDSTGFVFPFSNSADIDTIINQLTKDNLSQAGHYIGDTLDTIITDKILTDAHSDILKKTVTVSLGSAIDAEKAEIQSTIENLQEQQELLQETINELLLAE